MSKTADYKTSVNLIGDLVEDLMKDYKTLVDLMEDSVVDLVGDLDRYWHFCLYPSYVRIAKKK